jgi:exonuclease VII large subunit
LRGKAGEAASKIADVAQQTGTQAKEVAASLASDAKQKARGLLNMQVTAGADLAGHLAESAHCAAENLDQNAPQLAELVRGAAERVDEFAQDLRGQTVEDLVRTASDFTRRQPALMFGLASLAGFLAFRVFKSTPSRGSGNQSARSDDPYRDRQFTGERLGQFHGT